MFGRVLNTRLLLLTSNKYFVIGFFFRPRILLRHLFSVYWRKKCTRARHKEDNLLRNHIFTTMMIAISFVLAIFIWFEYPFLTLLRMGFFWTTYACGRGGVGDGAESSPLKKIKKIYETRDTPFEFCWHQHFLTGD